MQQFYACIRTRSFGDHMSRTIKITRATCLTLPFIIAVDSIRSVGQQGIGLITDTRFKKWGTVSPCSTNIVQHFLKHRFPFMGLCHTPTLGLWSASGFAAMEFSMSLTPSMFLDLRSS